MDNKFKVVLNLFLFFPRWLSESPAIVIMWIIAIAGAFGQILYNTWFVSAESITFYFFLFISIIIIPTTIALIIEFRNKLQVKSPVKTRRSLIYAIIIAGLVTGIITIESVSFSIKFQLFMAKSASYYELLENFDFWEKIGTVYSVYVVPIFLFGIAYWVKTLKFR